VSVCQAVWIDRGDA